MQPQCTVIGEWLGPSNASSDLTISLCEGCSSSPQECPIWGRAFFRSFSSSSIFFPLFSFRLSLCPSPLHLPTSIFFPFLFPPCVVVFLRHESCGSSYSGSIVCLDETLSMRDLRCSDLCRSVAEFRECSIIFCSCYYCCCDFCFVQVEVSARAWD